MLKLLNSVLLVVILCERIQSIKGEALKCEFQDVGFPWGSMYTCHVSSLDNSRNNMVINSYTGTHLANRNNNDVKAIRIHSSNTKYIPEGLGSLFSLTAFLVEISELIEIKAENFRGMQNLEYLNLFDNKLTSVPSDTFSMLLKLKHINLYSNQIKYIGSGVFDQLTNLDIVYLQFNICVDEVYVGATAITQMKEDLKVICFEPISTTTTTTTTTQNPLVGELEALKNEAKEQQKNNEIELNKLRDDLKKEQLGNTKINEEKDALMEERDVLATEKGAWMKDRDALEMELNNKTSEINEQNKKFETNWKQPIEALDVKLNVMNAMMEHLLKASQEHQMECNEIIKLRAELVTAKEEQKKEQLEYLKVNKEKDALMKKKDAFEEELTEAKATCKINERSSV